MVHNIKWWWYTYKTAVKCIIYRFAERENRLQWPKLASLRIVIDVDQKLHVGESIDDFKNKVFDTTTATHRQWQACVYAAFS